MKARDFLKQYAKIESIIKNHREQIEFLKNVAQGCTISMDSDRVKSSSVGQRVENCVVKYADLETELKREIESAQALKKDILRKIEMLETKEYEVIYMLYIKGMMLKQVEIELKKSHSWVTMTHKRALSHLQSILDKQEVMNE